MPEDNGAVLADDIGEDVGERGGGLTGSGSDGHEALGGSGPRPSLVPCGDFMGDDSGSNLLLSGVIVSRDGVVLNDGEDVVPSGLQSTSESSICRVGVLTAGGKPVEPVHKRHGTLLVSLISHIGRAAPELEDTLQPAQKVPR